MRNQIFVRHTFGLVAFCSAAVLSACSGGESDTQGTTGAGTGGTTAAAGKGGSAAAGKAGAAGTAGTAGKAGGGGAGTGGVGTGGASGTAGKGGGGGSAGSTTGGSSGTGGSAGSSAGGGAGKAGSAGSSGGSGTGGGAGKAGSAGSSGAGGGAGKAGSAGSGGSGTGGSTAGAAGSGGSTGGSAGAGTGGSASGAAGTGGAGTGGTAGAAGAGGSAADPCAAAPCQNGGSCAGDGSGGYVCTCAAGYTGTNCETQVDNCASNPCLNGGSCTNGVNTYTCTCAPGTSGTNCDVIATGCLDLRRSGVTTSGLYLIDPDGAAGANAPFQVYCEMTTNGGGWTMIANHDADTAYPSPWGHTVIGTPSLTAEYSLDFVDKLTNIGTLLMVRNSDQTYVHQALDPAAAWTNSGNSLRHATASLDANLPYWVFAAGTQAGFPDSICVVNGTYGSGYLCDGNSGQVLGEGLMDKAAGDELSACGGFGNSGWKTTSGTNVATACNPTGFFSVWEREPLKDCKELLDLGGTINGTYVIDPDGAGGNAPFATQCDLTTAGGGWTLGFLKNSRDSGTYGNFGSGIVKPTSLWIDPTAASAAAAGPAVAGWVDLNGLAYTELRVSAYEGGVAKYTSSNILKTQLRIQFGQPGYLLYVNDGSPYYWCGGPRSYTDMGVGQVNQPAGAPNGCKGHGGLGSGWDFSNANSTNLGLTMCGNESADWMYGNFGGPTIYSYPSNGAAQAIWVRLGVSCRVRTLYGYLRRA